MSDDTPTQRFPQPGGDTPTERIDTGEMYGTPAGGYPMAPPPEKKSRGLLIGLIVAGVLLVVALIVLLIILLPKGDPQATPTLTPTAPASESPTPTPTPTETEAPAPIPPTIDAFSTGGATVFCGPDEASTDNELLISWATTGGVRVYFGIDVTDAADAPFFDNLPLSGNSNDNFPAGYAPFKYSCGPDSHTYTITVVDDEGLRTSKTLTVTDLAP